MHFGIFLEERRPGGTDLAAFQETLELADAAEAWGLDGLWLGEIHFNPIRSVSSAPLALASFIAARTRRIRVGLAVQVLPLGHPLRIAEEAATVDQLSEGRFDFGIGRSGSPRAYDILGIPYGESQPRFEECLQIILTAWKGERFSYHGRYYHFDNVLVGPRPHQLPHPPLRMASNSKETFPVVARLGLPLFVGLRDLDIPELRLRIADYRAAWREAGHPGDGDVCLRIPIYAAPTQKEAVEEPYENLTYFFQRHAELTRSGMGRGGHRPGRPAASEVRAADPAHLRQHPRDARRRRHRAGARRAPRRTARGAGADRPRGRAEPRRAATAGAHAAHAAHPHPRGDPRVQVSRLATSPSALR
jgi:alkanesulfonate monooxygenase SsuD/methylene tetrahydromethanopterin reductase-like flavin-dependent oxidoreductase (luciferase family)